MDTIELDGVTYVKASVVAKRFKYTADYVGQLCRGRKIDARLVGRTWFVNPESLEEHKQQRYQTPEQLKKSHHPTTSETESKKPTRVMVPPPAKLKNPREIHHSLSPTTREEERTLRVSYEPDEGTLIPTLHKEELAPAHALRVSPADAKKVRIKGSRKEASFTPEELPDVALSGKVMVTLLEDTAEPVKGPTAEDTQNISEKTLEINNISDKQEHNSQPTTTPKSKRTVTIRKHRRQYPAIATTETPAAEGDARSDEVRQQSTPSFLPASVRQQPVPAPASTLVAVSPLVATVAAALFVLFIFSASTTVVFNDLGYQSQIVLQVANLLEIISR